VAALLSGCAADSAIEPSPNRAKYEGQSFAEAMPQCLSERGWDTEAVGDDELKSEVDPAQRDAFRSAQQECLVETGYFVSDRPLTEAEVGDWYDGLVRSSECLEDIGYAPPPAPSRQTFIDAHFNDPSASSWDPYPLPNGAGEWAEIEEACPQPGLEGSPVQSFNE
jgi:hypothetical protein